MKGLWLPEGSNLPTSLFGGGFAWPVMVAKRTALEHNIATMAAYCAERGFSHAPHGKTTMSPALFEAQLRAGAWAITVATPHQLLAARKFGVSRVVFANLLVDPVPIKWLSKELREGFECLSFVDSTESVRALAGVPMPVLIELGFAGGRTGCRTLDAVLEVGRAVAETPGVTLAGIAGFEGMLATADDITAFLGRMREAALALSREGLLGEEVIVSAGGSAFFDAVAREFGGEWLPGHRLHVVLRSGAYVTHDHGFYTDKAGKDMFLPALELWAQVLSTPEEGLAVVGMGKRDAPHDEGLPVPLWTRTAGLVEDASACTVTRLNDQHAYVRVPAGMRVRVGDLMCFGISHPCTAFDKWRVIPVVEDDYSVGDFLETYF